jgi:hypothetical protein
MISNANQIIHDFIQVTALAGTHISVADSGERDPSTRCDDSNQGRTVRASGSPAYLDQYIAFPRPL